MKCIDSPCLLALRVTARPIEVVRLARGTRPGLGGEVDPVAATVLGPPCDPVVVRTPTVSPQ